VRQDLFAMSATVANFAPHCALFAPVKPKKGRDHGRRTHVDARASGSE
jgi:hypothetical protein